MKERNRNIGKAQKRAALYHVFLLTCILAVTSCSEDGVAPESPPADRSPVMCVSYYDQLNGDLKFSMKTGEIWGEPEVISFFDDTGQWSSLALDADGFPHISSYDATHGNVKYVYQSSCDCGWYAETIDYVGRVGAYTSLAFDTQGHPHISYYDDTKKALKHAERISGSWIIETVDNTGSVGAYTSLALDAQGNPRISYRDNLNEDLKYASKVDGFWLIETVDTDGSVGWHTSLALDARGNPHISYSERYFEETSFPCICTLAGGALKYAVKKEGSWKCMLVDVESGQFSSLALDAQGNPHISYYEYGLSMFVPLPPDTTVCAYEISGSPKYATGIDGFWVIETIDDSFWIQGSPDWLCADVEYCSFLNPCTSTTFDARGMPCVSYYDYRNGNFKCATKVGRFWVVDTVDNAAGVGFFSSLAQGFR